MAIRPHLPAAVLLMTSAAGAQLRPGSAASVGLSEIRLSRAAEILETEVKAGRVGAAAILVARRERIVLHKAFGHATPDSVFLVASITKPVTACAVMLLVERGLVSLHDPVPQYVPEFSGGERDKVRVLDLLAHTSGLPDMLPENKELRRAHAPLSEFVKRTCATPLLYSPQQGFSYQSMGILLAGEIVERLARTPLRDFERREIFEPLGMKNTSLGLGGRRIEDTLRAVEPPGWDPKDVERFGWNTQYWRDLGAPWGGMHTTTTDLAILLETFLHGGSYAGKRLLSPVTARAMITDQNARLNAPWGIGWALGRSTAWNYFGDLVSQQIFGHVGATGTMAWADPETHLLCVLLTNHPPESDQGRLFRLLSNAVAASVEN